MHSENNISIVSSTDRNGLVRPSAKWKVHFLSFTPKILVQFINKESGGFMFVPKEHTLEDEYGKFVLIQKREESIDDNATQFEITNDCVKDSERKLQFYSQP